MYTFHAPQILQPKPLLSFCGLSFECVALILSFLHTRRAFSVLRKVCKEWLNIVDQVFTFSPNFYSPYRLSFRNHVIGVDSEGIGEEYLKWNAIISNLIGYLNEYYADLTFTLVMRVEEHERIVGLESNIKQIADELGVTGYVQVQCDSYRDNELNPQSQQRILDISCRGIPLGLDQFLSTLAEIRNSGGESIINPSDVNMISNDRKSFDFKIKTTERYKIDLNGEEDLQESTEDSYSISILTIHTATVNKNSLSKLTLCFKKRSIVWFLFLVVNQANCPDIIVKLLNLFHLLEYRKCVSDLLVEMAVVTSEIEDPDEQPMEPIWQVCVDKCMLFLENSEGARNIVYFSYGQVR